MKIIVMNSADTRIEVLSVPDNMPEEDRELVLAEPDYACNDIYWVASPIELVPL